MAVSSKGGRAMSSDMENTCAISDDARKDYVREAWADVKTERSPAAPKERDLVLPPTKRAKEDSGFSKEAAASVCCRLKMMWCELFSSSNSKKTAQCYPRTVEHAQRKEAGKRGVTSMDSEGSGADLGLKIKTHVTASRRASLGRGMDLLRPRGRSSGRRKSCDDLDVRVRTL